MILVTWMNLRVIKCRKSDLKDCILYDSFHMKCPEKKKSVDTDSGCLGLGWEQGVTTNGYEEFWGNDCSVPEADYVMSA